MKTSTTIHIEQLKRVCTEIFMQAGLSLEDARIITDVLVTTDMRGIKSHGVMRIEHYVRCILSGGIKPKADLAIEQEGPTWARVNGSGGLGIGLAYKAVNLAMEKAAKSGTGMVTVNNSHHFGAAGYYSMMCAKQDMIGIAMSTGDPIMAVTGSAVSAIGNNPFSYAAPADTYGMVVLDIAMSKAADGKIQLAHAAGTQLPEGAILDKHGQPSTDPGDYLNGGTLLPFGDYKGYGLAVMVEVLAGVLSGGAITSDIRSWNKDPQHPGNTGHCFIAIDIASFTPVQEFKIRMKKLIERIQSARRAQGVERILYPGQLELERERDAEAQGTLELEASCISLLRSAGEQLGISLDF